MIQYVSHLIGPLVSFPIIWVLLLASCHDNLTKKGDVTSVNKKQAGLSSASSKNPSCAPTSVHQGSFPSVSKKHQSAEYWIKQWDASQLDSPLLTINEIEQQNRAVGKSEKYPFSQWDLQHPISDESLESQIQNRLGTIVSQINAGKLVLGSNKRVPPDVKRYLHRNQGTLANSAQMPIYEVALEPIQMRCVPYLNSLYKKDSDMAFDKNACSRIAPQEPLEILGSWPNKMLFVRTSYAFGFIDNQSKRSVRIPENLHSTYFKAPRMRTSTATTVKCNNAEISIPAFTTVPAAGSDQVWIATDKEFCQSDIDVKASHTFQSTLRPLTRRQFYETAFQYIHLDYGLGGSNGGRDCSRFLMDTLSSFDIVLPRNSKHQSKAGSYSINVSHIKDSTQKLQILDAANQKGIVALYFPGHIMFYLGRTDSNIPMAIHALGEYAKPCSPSGETVYRVKKIVVTDLSLGKSSSRRSFLERITRIVVFSNATPKSLEHNISMRPASPLTYPADACDDSVHARIFQSPKRLITGEPARLIATNTRRASPVTIQIWDKNQTPIFSQTHTLGGPPFTYWTQFIPTRPGRYTVAIGDGENIVACDRFGVATYRSKKKAREPETTYWDSKWKWEPDTENFFSAFIEQLFNFPLEMDVSWSGLHDLLNDPTHNLLHNHLGQNEDQELHFSPDCADLPYFLRAYFAWKTRLPFGVRSCSRGRKGRPPSCGDIITNQEIAPIVEKNLDSDAKVFEQFASVVIGWNAHSASGRTHPASNHTDFYPVALKRESLPPGTIFTDPYGHVMMISKWFGQPLGGSGVLMAIDGQPDGTVGRRRFWRGTFLFDPDTTSFGAGFKRFRPITIESDFIDEVEQRIAVPVENKDLKRSRIFTRYSLDQYQGNETHFYDRMQQLINPTPLLAEDLLRSRVDALEESVKRRIQAISNGEEYMKNHQYQPIDMPLGYQIFQTEGPWENYSTPSRDMRLLIAIDAVMELPEKVLQFPTRFGFTKDSDLPRIVSNLKEILDAELKDRSVQYVRSDGTKWQLTLAQLVQRQKNLEFAYNPNDCIEKRWGAPPQSKENSSCNRLVPKEQKERMEEYRNWFTQRKRPQRE